MSRFIHAPHTLVQMCHCGHHKDTHFNKGAGACLGARCDECPGYRDASKPDTLKKEAPPDSAPPSSTPWWWHR